MDETDTTWFDREVSGCHLADERLKKRLCDLLSRIGGAMGETIPRACQDWAHTKAAYRFFSNDRVNEADIMVGHFAATRERMAGTEDLAFVLHDTSRGREPGHPGPPAQIRACAANALGSCLECLTSKRLLGQGWLILAGGIHASTILVMRSHGTRCRWLRRRSERSHIWMT
ncbi:hypothetical protein AiwAL_18100 [Acidiphilium sp. AL]|nr:hypothetical protein [Acidiphilium sp. AL]